MAYLAAGRESAEVTDWAARTGWVLALLSLVVVVSLLMASGWRRRAGRQADLPEPPRQSPSGAAGEPRLTMAGRYHGSTIAGQWLDRIVAHGLGTRSRAELTLTDEGLEVVRPGARDFFVPTAALRGARLDRGIAGKVLTQGGLLVVTWELGGRAIDSGFRSDRVADHPAWVEALSHLSRGPADVAAAQHDQEGASS
ncbi:PH-like domain-containing protein [Streptomyces sp. TP-A0874]|uniref:PH-like domain-containing protein n=1 Tax=Streptomyces sp. TP-A0874 TaxID=549819 RepID=UPI0008535ACF|nr:hypothetical protein [Streptomyces sp. TP-A0874]